MKQLLLSLFLATVILASENYELKLYEKILPLIFQTDKLVVFTDSSSQEIFQNSKIFSVTSQCNKAIVVVGKSFENSCKNKPIFSTSYRNFEKLDNSFGVFYWRNGTPRIGFNLEKIEKFNLFLPKSLKKYAK